MICSEISSINDIWVYNETNEKMKVENVVSQLLDDYEMDDVLHIIYSQYGVKNVFGYFIIKTKFWENRINQVIIVLLFLLILYKMRY
jgi:hypothetical protein